MTLNCCRSNFVEIARDFAIFGGNNGYTNEDSHIMSATECSLLKVFFSMVGPTDHVDIAGLSCARGLQTREGEENYICVLFYSSISRKRYKSFAHSYY